ncbi:MAG: M48 family metallopeptidase [Micropepsaceae bacterium]
MRIILALLGAAALGACASPKPVPLDTITSAAAASPGGGDPQARLKALLTDEQRLNDVFGRLVTSNADLCGADYVPAFGFRLWSLSDFADPIKPAAVAAFGVDERLQVYAVAAGQPAAEAGIRPGDILRTVEGKALADGLDGRRQFAEGVTAGLLKRGAVRFTFLRGKKTVTVRLKALKSCPFAVALAVGDDPNAATDGVTVFVTTGMLDFATQDRDLATVLGHEIAHAIRGDAQIKTDPAKPRRSGAGRVVGAVIDAAAGVGDAAFEALGLSAARRNSIAAEVASDRLGLYLAARAGYDVSAAPDIWRRLDKEYPSTSDGGWTHPSSSDRYEMMRETAAEIAEKRAAGEALIPDPSAAPQS